MLRLEMLSDCQAGDVKEQKEKSQDSTRSYIIMEFQVIQERERKNSKIIKKSLLTVLVVF